VLLVVPEEQLKNDIADYLNYLNELIKLIYLVKIVSIKVTKDRVNIF